MSEDRLREKAEEWLNGEHHDGAPCKLCVDSLTALLREVAREEHDQLTAAREENARLREALQVIYADACGVEQRARAALDGGKVREVGEQVIEKNQELYRLMADEGEQSTGEEGE